MGVKDGIMEASLTIGHKKFQKNYGMMVGTTLTKTSVYERSWLSLVN